MKRESEALIPSLKNQLSSSFSQVQTLVRDHPELESSEYYKKSVELINQSQQLVERLVRG